MTHNSSLDWKIYVAGEDSISVYIDDPSEGFWFRSITEAEQFRRTLTNDQNIDPFAVFIRWPAK